ncbi:cell wall hydrolase [Paenibacillus mucilaginosus]|uniref:cell wall hydrolase n=1 Tax=Paenibacillus mucilaginosus TaxID=61624 RepID=UPI0005A05733
MKRLTVAAAILAGALGVLGTSETAHALTLKQGSKSAQVLDLQERLASLGYFKVGTTGYYGTVTEAAVKKFQKAYRLPADGIANDATLAKLKKVTKDSGNTLEQMARIIHAEARGETYLGQVAVGAVVMNRVHHSMFPGSIREVIFQDGQFDAVADGQYNLKPNASAYRAAREALNGSDPTKGSLFYYNPKIATSEWSKARPRVVKIGNHVFTR